MAAPTFISYTDSGTWDTVTAENGTVTITSVSVQTGDVLVVICGTQDGPFEFQNMAGGGLTWTQQQRPNADNDFNHSTSQIWTATATSTTSFNITANLVDQAASNSARAGMGVYVFRDAQIGASAGNEDAGTAPSLALTTTADNSAIVFVSGDWNTADGVSRVWRTINSVTPTAGNGLEKLYFRNASWYSAHSAYWDDVGTAGSKTTGQTAPTGQRPNCAVIEIKGPASNVTRIAVTTGAPANVSAFAPTLPSHITGDRLILAVVGKGQTTTIPTINQSWVLVGSGTGGTGTVGTDTGQTFWAVYAKDATSSSETAPTVTPGGTAPDSWEWICSSHRPGVSKTWADSIGASAAWVQAASDTNTSSPLTGTAGAWTGVQPTTDDAIFVVGAIPTDLGTALGATTLTATGLAGGTKTTATSQYVENSLGGDTAAVWAGWTGFTGPASAGLAVSFTVTGATNQSGSIIAVALRQQAGGTAHTVTQTDDAGLTDTSVLDRSLVYTDSAGLTDTRIFDQTESFTDTTGLADTAALTIGPVATDSVGLTDTSLVQSGKVVDATDTTGLTDSAVLTRNLVYTDDAGLTDVAALPRALELIDLTGLTDVAVAQAAKFTTVDDTTGLTDTAVLARTLAYTDTTGLIDAAPLARSLVYTDSSGLTDTSTVQAAKLIVVTDSAGLTDVGLTLNVADDFTDTTGLTDTTSIAATGAAVYTDSAGLTDTRAFARSSVVTDSAGLTDTVSPALSGAGMFTDSAGLTDTTVFIQSDTVTDDAGLTDARVIDLSKIQTDSSGLTDTALISAGKILDVTDSAGLTDSQVSSQAKSITDDAGLTDTPIFAAAKSLTDLVGLTDVALVIGQRDITITDSAGLTDIRIISKGLEPTDSVGLTDTQAFAAAYRYTDSVGLTDTSLIDLQVPVVFGRGASKQGNAQTGSTGRALAGSGRAGRG